MTTIFEQVEGGASGNLITAVFGKTGQLVNTKGRKAPGDGGRGTYMIKTAAQATLDGDIIDEIGAGFTVADGKVAVNQASGSANPRHYGAGLGLGNDIPALTAAMATAGSVTLVDGDVYDGDGGSWFIPDGSALLGTQQATLENFALIECTHSVGIGITLGDIHFKDITRIEIGGAELPANHMTGVVFGDIKCTDAYLVIRYVTGMVGRTIDVTWTADLGAARQAMAPVCWYNCNVESISLKGFYSMGFQTTGNGTTNDIFATKDTYIGKLFSDRDPTAFTEAGHHGFYLLGNSNLDIGTIYSIGYYLESGTTANAVKFRDNWDCDIGPLACDRMQIASDANLGTPLLDCKNNRFEAINLKFDPLDEALVGRLTVTFSGAGSLDNNVIEWFYGEYATGQPITAGTHGAIVFTGLTVFTNTSDIANVETKFLGADVTWADSDTLLYGNDLNISQSLFRGDVRTESNVFIDSTTIEGLLRQATPSSNTRSLTLKNVSIDGTLTSLSGSGRITNTFISHVNVNANRFTAGAVPGGGTLLFRFLSFNDAYYLDETGFVAVP